MPVICFSVIIALAGCDTRPPPDSETERLTVWAHTGQPQERETLERQVQAFNARHADLVVRLSFLPEGAYNGQVQAAAIAGRLPDLLELDGPYVANYAWQGVLLPLDDLLPAELRADLLPSILAQGRYGGHFYAVGSFDSGLGLWADRRRLRAAGVRLPTGPGASWDQDEFHHALAALAAQDPDGAVLDLKLNYPSEWLTYAFSPWLQSAGADLIDRDTGRAGGTLDGPQAVAAMTALQRWFEAGYVDPNMDDSAFTGGRTALAWGGHWNYPAYREALGEHLALLPLPRYGPRLVTGQGSWTWTITRRCRNPKAALRFLRYLLAPSQVLAMSAANGGVPATRRAVHDSPLYRPGGALHLFVRPRPRTPAYPLISSAFAQAFRDIRAAALIDQQLRRHPFSSMLTQPQVTGRNFYLSSASI